MKSESSDASATESEVGRAEETAEECGGESTTSNEVKDGATINNGDKEPKTGTSMGTFGVETSGESVEEDTIRDGMADNIPGSAWSPAKDTPSP